MSSTRIRAAVRHQWAGLIALFLVLSGGSAWALDGSNTVFSDDIVDGEVKTPDLGAGAVVTGKIADGQVKSADVGPGEVRLSDIGASAVDTSKIADGQVKSADVLNNNLTADDLATASVGGAEVKDGAIANADVAPNSIASGKILDGTLTGADVANNSLKGADIDESTLDVGDAERAYAFVNPFCSGAPETCSFTQSKGVSSVIRGEHRRVLRHRPGDRLQRDAGGRDRRLGYDGPSRGKHVRDDI